ELVTIMINKPVGYVSAQAEDGYVPAVRLVNLENHSETDQTGQSIRGSHFAGLAPAGRLDIDSQGLLVLTQDGRIAKQLIGENSDIEKEYLVRVEGDISDDQIERLIFGLELDGKPLKHAKVRQLNPEQLQIILMEGKKRQIRRMCEAVGLHVTGLKRVRVGELRLGKLEEGKWRFVKAEEFRHRTGKPTSSTHGGREAKVSRNEKETSPKQTIIPSDGKSLYGKGKARPKRRD
ncbi:MAG: 23S rRNA pseudouridine2604 synthase, partial [Polaribacter sp.]